MAISNFPNGFSNGVTVRGVPVNVAHPGQAFFLNNSGVLGPRSISASDSNAGTYQKPFATLAGALAQCTPSRGDIIYVNPGHAETISSATALSLSIAGVAIIGLGVGNLRPTFTLDTANTSTINVTANQITIINCLFKANFLAIASLFTLTNAKDFTLNNCEFRDNSAVLNFARIVTTSATSNAADGLLIQECQMYGLGATSNSCLVKMQGTNDRLGIRGCYVAHAAVTDAGLMPISTGKVITNAQILDNILNFVGSTAATTGTCITTDGTTNSGIMGRNFIQSLDATTEILVTASSGLIFSQNYSSAVADKSGYLVPGADS